MTRVSRVVFPGFEMMAEIVNLRHARKQKARGWASKEAAERRAKFGRCHAEREATEGARALETKRLEAHRREGVDDRAE